MKQTLNFFSFLMVMLIFSLSISASSSTGPSIAYPDVGVTIQFEDDTQLTSEMRQTIADSIVFDTSVAQTYSLCWLTGHDTTTETVTATYHKERTLDPRCRLDVYLITTCSNCDYYVEELHSSGYISCCPED